MTEGDLTHCNITTPYEGRNTELGSGVCNAHWLCYGTCVFIMLDLKQL